MRLAAQFATHVDYAVGHVPFGVAVGDFNRDGKLDVAVTNSADNTVSILLGNGDGTFKPQVAYPTGAAPTWIVVADFNKDGKLDKEERAKMSKEDKDKFAKAFPKKKDAKAEEKAKETK